MARDEPSISKRTQVGVGNTSASVHRDVSNAQLDVCCFPPANLPVTRLRLNDAPRAELYGPFSLVRPVYVSKKKASLQSGLILGIETKPNFDQPNNLVQEAGQG